MRLGNHMTVNSSGEKITGNHNRITGNGNTITGNHNAITGNNNIVTGNHNKVSGNNNQGTGNHNTANGTGNQWNGSYNKVDGQASEKKEDSSYSSYSFNDGTMVINGGSSNGSMIIDGGNIQIDNLVMSARSSSPMITIHGRRYDRVPLQSGTTTTEKKPKKEEESDELPFIECPLESDKDVVIADDAPEGTPTCVVCLSNAPICVLLPCMHKCMCCTCGRQLTGDGLKRRGEVECPLCKKKVERVAKVFDN